MALKDRKIAFIGGGQITEIIVSNLIKTDTIVPRRLIVSDPDQEKGQTLHDKYGISMAGDNMEAVNAADFVFINVLPDVVTLVLEELSRKEFPRGKVIITVAGGIPIKTYAVLGAKIPLVRALPNPPSQVGMGMAALCFNTFVSENQQKDILALFSYLGEFVILEEEHINTVMALSSPAMIYMFFQSLIDAGVRAGIDRSTSTRITYQTIVGSMAVWKKRQVPAYELINEAGTPGGISVESLFTLEKYAFKAAIMDAIDSAIKRAAELGRSVEK